MPITAESRTWAPVETRDPEVLDQVYRLRVEAWRARNPVFPRMNAWSDAFDTVGRHWVVLETGEPVAAARLTVHAALAEAPSAEIYRGVLPDDLPGPVGVLTRLVVAPSHAGLGLSRALDLARIDAARAEGCRHLIGGTFDVHPRAERMRALGFKVVGRAAPYDSGPLRSINDGHDQDPTVIVSLDLSRLRPTAD